MNIPGLILTTLFGIWAFGTMATMGLTAIWFGAGLSESHKEPYDNGFLLFFGYGVLCWIIVVGLFCGWMITKGAWLQ